MFEHSKDQPRRGLASWLGRVFGGKKDEPTKAVEAFSLDMPEEPTAAEVQNQSRMTEEYKEFLQEQEKTWPQETPDETREVPCTEADRENAPAETPVTEAGLPTEMIPEEPASEEAPENLDETV